MFAERYVLAGLVFFTIWYTEILTVHVQCCLRLWTRSSTPVCVVITSRTADSDSVVRPPRSKRVATLCVHWLWVLVPVVCGWRVARVRQGTGQSCGPPLTERTRTRTRTRDGDTIWRIWKQFGWSHQHGRTWELYIYPSMVCTPTITRVSCFLVIHCHVCFEYIIRSALLHFPCVTNIDRVLLTGANVITHQHMFAVCFKIVKVCKDKFDCRDSNSGTLTFLAL
jgi:hypothetical protein